MSWAEDVQDDSAIVLML